MRRRYVTAFIDWNSQKFNARNGSRREDVDENSAKAIKRQIKDTLDYVSDALVRLLNDIEKKADKFSVEMRIYYGWHEGLTATLTRKCLEEMIKDREVPNSKSNLSFDWSNPFGDVLLDALDRRKHPKARIHLPNTLRRDSTNGIPREKMVDTALACDLLSQTRMFQDYIKIIMVEDDDVIPAAFVSEKWNSGEGKTVIARKRERDGNFLRLDGLVKRI